MSENSKIEWCDHTFNPWIGCMAISPGCANCYAAAWAKRYGRDFADRTRTKTWAEPIRWNTQHAEFFAAHGRRQRVFCASLADVFDNAVDPSWRADLFDLIERTPNLDWLLLTKRIGNVMSMVSQVAQYQFDLECLERPRLHDNVWLGATIVNQEEADRDIPKLLAVPARVRFLSVEPMLGPIDLERPMPGPDIDQGGGASICQPWMIQSGIDWVICGGESGPDARPMHPEWPRDLRDQCKEAGVPFLFKQWGEWAPGENCGGPMKRTEHVADWWDGEWKFDTLTPGASVGMHYDDEPTVYRVGKKTAGRHIDGRTHDEFPEAK